MKSSTASNISNTTTLSMPLVCWRATNIDQERALNFDQAFYCVANYATVDKFTRL